MNNLKKFIKEEVKKILKEYEYYVDKQGYAHDDEGNTWFVGAADTGTSHGSLKGMPKTHRPNFRRTAASMPFSKKEKETMDALMTAFYKMPKSDFMKSVVDQYERKRYLSDKQLNVLKRIFKKLDMEEEISKLT